MPASGNTRLPVAILFAFALRGSVAYSSYRDNIPNSALVKDCAGNSWAGVGHQRSTGGGPRNPFGEDFKAAGYQWTPELCQKDSDGDGLTNGRELGDPSCTWAKGGTPEFTTGVTHPGIDCGSLQCDGTATTSRRRLNAAEPKGCAKYQAPTTKSHDFAFPPHAVGAGTTYIKAAFTWPEGSVSAVTRFEILNRNPNVVHHMILYGCPRDMSSIFEPPKAASSMGCSDMLMAWAVGGGDFCAPQGISFNIDPSSPYFMLEIHYDNPKGLSGLVDTSGFRLHYVPYAGSGLEPAAIAFVGASLPTITVPPGLPAHRATATVSSRVIGMPATFEGIRIFAHGLHMHGIGRKMWMTAVNEQNGALDEVACNTNYDFDLQEVVLIDQPFLLKPGMSLKVECVYNSTSRSTTTHGGDETQDEMCLSAIMYTPNVQGRSGLLVRDVEFDSSPTSGDHVCGCPGGVRPTPGGGGTGSVIFDMVLAGSVSDFVAAQQTALREKLSAAFLAYAKVVIPPERIHLHVTAGSITVTVTVATASIADEPSIVQLVERFTPANVNSGLQGTGMTVEAISPARRGSDIAATAEAAAAAAADDYQRRLDMLTAHGWLMLAAWGLLAPMGALVPRTWRSALPSGGWFRLHWLAQSSTLILTTAGVGLSIAATEKHFDTANGTHKVLGLVLIIVAFVQLALGLARPHKAAKGGKPSTRRFSWHVLHGVLGTAAIGLGIWQIITGAKKWEEYGLLASYSLSTDALYAILGAMLALAALVGVIGLIVGKVRPRPTAPPYDVQSIIAKEKPKSSA